MGHFHAQSNLLGRRRALASTFLSCSLSPCPSQQSMRPSNQGDNRADTFRRHTVLRLALAFLVFLVTVGLNGSERLGDSNYAIRLTDSGSVASKNQSANSIMASLIPLPQSRHTRSTISSILSTRRVLQSPLFYPLFVSCQASSATILANSCIPMCSGAS